MSNSALIWSRDRSRYSTNGNSSVALLPCYHTGLEVSPGMKNLLGLGRLTFDVAKIADEVRMDLCM